jgi:hypothetical protein
MADWELVIDTDSNAVRRFQVNSGWIYQVQEDRKYNSTPGSIGRIYDKGYRTWWPPVFVPDAR